MSRFLAELPLVVSSPRFSEDEAISRTGKCFGNGKSRYPSSPTLPKQSPTLIKTL